MSSTIDLGVVDVSKLILPFVKALHSAMTENWHALADQPQHAWPNFDRHFSTLAAERMIAELEDTSDWNDGSSCSDIDCRYSPLDPYELPISVSRDWTRRLTIWFPVLSETLSQVQGTAAQRLMIEKWLPWRGRTDFHPRMPKPGDMEPEELRTWYEEYNRLGNTPSLWPQNRQCLLNIVEHLKRALPVKEVQLDPRLLNDPAKIP